MSADTHEYQKLIIEIAKLEAKVEQVDTKLASMDLALKEICAQQNKWKGALAVALIFGGAIAWVLAQIRDWIR